MDQTIMDLWAYYLRKSRKDIEAELQGAGETLRRHRQELDKLAAKMKIKPSSIDIYTEIVSGDSIAARPEIQKLLEKVASGYYKGVLVVEVERLARGDTEDQGVIAKAFKYGNCLIVTPYRTYNPADEADEEYFEFGLFMSRREYKTINRRQQRGRLNSVKEGKYVAGTAPYGYKKYKLENMKGYSLQIVEDEAKIVRLIYNLYTKGTQDAEGNYHTLGMHLIAKHLDMLGIKPRIAEHWSRSTIKDILTNPTYIGKIRWQWRKEIKTFENGELIIKRPKDPDCILIDGIHDAIIDAETFEKAQAIMSGNKHTSVASNKILKNSLSGIIYCAKCGRLMTRINSRYTYSLACPNRDCDNISAPVELIEKELLAVLDNWISDYSVTFSNIDIQDDSDVLNDSIEKKKSEIATLKGQMNNTYSLLEQGVYSINIFRERQGVITEAIEKLEAEISTLSTQLESQLSNQYAYSTFLPHLQNVVDIYYKTDDIQKRNNLLKEVLEKVEYLKTTPNVKGCRNLINFELTVYPLLPKRESADKN